jgi:hypothetical protein
MPAPEGLGSFEMDARVKPVKPGHDNDGAKLITVNAAR